MQVTCNTYFKLQKEHKHTMNRISKTSKFLSIILSICLVMGSIVFFTPETYAASGVNSAKKAYTKAVNSEARAKAAYDYALKAYEAASVQYKKGSRGFFQWIINNYSDWRADDARMAIEVLDTTSFKSYTNEGSDTDATDLTLMKYCIELLPTMEKDRAGDENFRNLPPVKVWSRYMARAQVNANASAETYSHMGNDAGCSIDGMGECLAWGYSDPFVGWYDKEKKIYNSNKNAPFSEVGHYLIVCGGRDSDQYIVGLGGNDTDTGWFTTCLTAAAAYSDETAYTVSEYTNMFMQYYNAVYPKSEKAALDKATDAYDKALDKTQSKLSTLKKSLRPSVVSAKRKGKKTTVKWKKKSGAAGYQISVSTKKGKTKIVANAGKKKTKATVKVKKAKKQYVKVRAYVKVNGKKVYGKWSKAVRTN